ncbi:MAG: phosphoribosylformylglycinamidine synthase subunit PurS, partial [Myxococcota bacterium]|nr:phosphoribosylformylglycinamidine synthase subunit PurS [Myxococcota bacterium]
VRDVRLGKLVELDVDAVAGPEFDARIRQMSDKLLANTVIEDFTIELGD